jgi:hypothetical protein
MVTSRTFALTLGLLCSLALYVALRPPSIQVVAVAPDSPAALGVDVDSLITVRTPEAVAAARARAIRDIFGGPLPSGTRLPAGAVFLPAAGAPSSKLAIYHGGHEQRAEESPTVGILRHAGYDVYAISMPAGDHARFAAEDLPLRPFLEPVALTLNHALARRDYRDVIMVGLSGGGWTTVLYAAIDPRIQRSYPIAGSVPEYLQAVIPGSRGDFEQTLPGLAVGYLDLYVMGASGGREQLQLFNRHDPCCFAGDMPYTYRDVVQRHAAAVGGRFDVVVSQHDQHELAPTMAWLLWPAR